MNQFNANDSWNFFEKTLANRVPAWVPADAENENDQMLIDTLLKSMT